jgi:hypothetical protein
MASKGTEMRSYVLIYKRLCLLLQLYRASSSSSSWEIQKIALELFLSWAFENKLDAPGQE